MTLCSDCRMPRAHAHFELTEHTPVRCQVPAGHHSKDIVAVYHGSTHPLIACGFHASQGTQVCLDRIRVTIESAIASNDRTWSR